MLDAPPPDAAACAGLLAIADGLLGLASPDAVRERLRPLLPDSPRQARRTHWGYLLTRTHTGTGCSAGLRQAAEPLLRSFTRAAGRPHARREPTRPARFGPEHVPALLPADWYERHLAHLNHGLNPKLLRRTGAVRLVQMVAGGSMGEAAQFLGLTLTNPDLAFRNLIYSGAGAVHTWLKQHADPRAFDAALHALATKLDAAPHRVNYQQRREALSGWALDPETWQALTAQLPPTPGPVQPDLGDRKRQRASEVVWVRVTQGEHIFAPHPIEYAQPPDVRRSWRLQRGSTWFKFQTDRPMRHYADLRRLLDDYADRLAVRIDAGWLPG